MSQRDPESSQASRKSRTAGWNEPVRDAQPAEIGVLAEEHNDAMIGRVLRETYRIVSSLDEGGMGKLYRAEHLRLHRPVAVKFMTRNLAANAEALARFRREAEIISQLDHPHIVHVLDFDTTDDGEPYIVMELLMGMALSQRIAEQQTLPVRETAEIALQISSGLMLAHKSGVVHRDLKPDNVFLLSMSDKRTFVKLLDFGISMGNTTGARLTGRYDVLGTPDYMAPEQAVDTSKVDHRADQWSLACIVYEMLTCNMPFPGETVVQVLSKVVTSTPLLLTEHNPDIPRAVQEVVMRGLSKAPAERYSTIGEFAESLAQAAHIQVNSYGPILNPQNQNPATSLTDPAPPPIDQRRTKTKPEGSNRAGSRKVNPHSGDIQARTAKPKVVVKPFAEFTEPRRNSAKIGKELPKEPTAPHEPNGKPRLTTVRPPRARLRAASHGAGSHDTSPKVESGRIRRYSKAKIGSERPWRSEAAGPSPVMPNKFETTPVASNTATPVTPNKFETTPEIATMRLVLDSVRASVALGEDQHAIDNARNALKVAQVADSRSVQSELAAAADVMIPVLLGALGGPSKVLALNALNPSAQDESMNPQLMFLLSRIGGRATIEELLDVTPLSAMETLGMLLEFLEQGYLTVK